MHIHLITALLATLLSSVFAAPATPAPPKPMTLEAIQAKFFSNKTLTSATSPSLSRRDETEADWAQPLCFFDTTLPMAVQYAVILPDDGTPTQSGWDSAGNCGGGFLDNIHGNGVIATTWQCYYGGTVSAIASFWTIIDQEGAITSAYNDYTENSYTWEGCVQWGTGGNDPDATGVEALAADGDDVGVDDLE